MGHYFRAGLLSVPAAVEALIQKVQVRVAGYQDRGSCDEEVFSELSNELCKGATVTPWGRERHNE